MAGQLIPFGQAALQLLLKYGPRGIAQLRRQRKNPFDFLMQLMELQQPEPGPENPAQVVPFERPQTGGREPGSYEGAVKQQQRQRVKEKHRGLLAEENKRAEKLERARAALENDEFAITDEDTEFDPNLTLLETNDYISERSQPHTPTGEDQEAAQAQVRGVEFGRLIPEENTGLVSQDLSGATEGRILTNPITNFTVIELATDTGLIPIPLATREGALALLNQGGIGDPRLLGDFQLAQFEKFGVKDPYDVLFK